MKEVSYKISQKYCQGATQAQRDFQEALKLLRPESEETLLVWDFSKVTVVTASYLRGTLYLALFSGMLNARPQRDAGEIPLGARSLPLFTGVAGCNEEVEEEINEFFAGKQMGILFFSKKEDQKAGVTRTLGAIDGALGRTLDLLSQLKSGTAADLAAQSDERISLNGWNNRLSDLYDRRLVSRQRAGKFWVYSTLAERIKSGSRLHTR